VLFNGGGTCADGLAERGPAEFVCQPFEFVNSYFNVFVRNFEAGLFFPGAFTFHVPLDQIVKQDSYFEQFERYFELSL
jgi:hypothetical protein